MHSVSHLVGWYYNAEYSAIVRMGGETWSTTNASPSVQLRELYTASGLININSDCGGGGGGGHVLEDIIRGGYDRSRVPRG